MNNEFGSGITHLNCHPGGRRRRPIGSLENYNVDGDSIASLQNDRRLGFTLVEMLVVVALLAAVTAMATSLFFSYLKGGAKSNVMALVKQNGDYALTVMERMIRNSREISLCAANFLTIKNPDGRETTFICNESAIPSVPTKIASNSAFLTSDNVEVSCASLFTCPTPPDTKIGISFTVSQFLPGVTPRAGEQAQMDFQTTITPRNY